MWNKVVIFFACVLIYIYKRSFQSERSSIQFYYKYFVYYAVVFVATALSWPLFLIRPRNVQNIKILTPIGRLISRAINLSWELRDGDVLSKDRGAVIVSNHQSSLDILGQLHIWDHVDKMTVIAKKELFYLWPFGLTAYLLGIVFVDRRKTKEAYKTLFAASEVMTRDKTKIWIFPEGTRNHNPEFLPFKKGAFTLAVASQMPIIPVVYSPYHFLDVQKKTFDDGQVIIQCLEEVSTKGMTQEDVPALMDNVRNKMYIAYKQLSKEVLNDPPSKFNTPRNCT